VKRLFLKGKVMTNKFPLLKSTTALGLFGLSLMMTAPMVRAEAIDTHFLAQEVGPIWLPGMRAPNGMMGLEMGDDVSLGTDDGEIVTPPPDPIPEPEPEPMPEYKNDDPAEPPVTTTTQTNQLVASLELTRNTCDLYNRTERVDCLREEYNRIVQRLPTGGDYGAMKTDLAIAVAELDAIVAANAAPTPPVRRTVEVNGKRRSSARPIRAIAENRLDAANAAAAAVLDRLSTKLLRSASSAGAQAVHYQRAAQAIDSTKVLLRST
jgi:hypothetical protein